MKKQRVPRKWKKAFQTVCDTSTNEHCRDRRAEKWNHNMQLAVHSEFPNVRYEIEQSRLRQMYRSWGLRKNS